MGLSQWSHGSVNSGPVLKQGVMVANSGLSKAAHLKVAIKGPWGEVILGQDITGMFPIGLLPSPKPSS